MPPPRLEPDEALVEDQLSVSAEELGRDKRGQERRSQERYDSDHWGG